MRKTALPALLVMDAAAFLLFFAVAVLNYTPNAAIPSLATRWEFSTAVLGLFQWMPALHFIALAWTASMPGAGKPHLAQLFIPALTASLLLAALALTLTPIMERQRQSVLSSSARFNASLASARAALEGGRLEEARESWLVLESIDRDDHRVESLKNALASAELRADRESGPKPARPQARTQADRSAAQAAYLKALGFFEKRDYYSAHWHAALAQRLDPDLAEARRIAARSWEAILDLRGGLPEDSAKARFHGRKIEGYTMLRASDYVGAYRLFTELKGENPSDPDVGRYLAESLKGLREEAFFRQEADEAAAKLGVPRLFLRFPSSAAGEGFIAAAETAFAGSAVYFREFEYLEAEEGGAYVRVSAPYAKLLGDRILLTAVEKDAPDIVYRSRSGRAAKPDLPASGEAAGPESLPSPFPAESLWALAAARENSAILGLLEALDAGEAARSHGVALDTLGMDILGRLGLLISSIASIPLGMVLGLRLRATGSLGRASRYGALAPLAMLGLGSFFLLGQVDKRLSAWAAHAFPSINAALSLSLGIRLAAVGIIAALLAGLRGPEAESERE